MTDIERLVADEWKTVPAERHIVVADPADGTEFLRAPVAGPDDVAAAAKAARAAAPEWAGTLAAERATAVAAVADAVAARIDDLARLTTREMGKPLGDARGGVEAGIGTLRQYAQL